MKIRTFAKLGDICDVSAGQGAPQGDSNYCDNGTPFVKAGNLIELIQGKKETEIQKVSEDVAKKHKLKKYPVGSLLFAKSGMSCMKGYVYQLKNDSYVVSHLAIVKPKKDSSDYIEYCLRHIKPNSLVKDEAYPSISLQDISNLEIPLPSLEEQVKIADQLSKCTQIINKHKEQLEKYDFLIKSRFIEMFGDPVQNSKGYKYKKLEELGKWESGGTPSRKNNDYFKGSIPWYSAGELNSLYLYDSNEKITETAIEESSAKLFRKGSLFVGMYDTAAFKMGIATTDCSSNQACANIFPNRDVNVIWLYYELMEMKEFFLQNRRGVRQKNLSLGMIKGFEIPYAPSNLQNDFAAFVQQIDKSKFEIWLTLQNYGIIEKRVF